MFLLVPAYPGCLGQTAVKWLLLLLALSVMPAAPVYYRHEFIFCKRAYYCLLIALYNDLVSVGNFTLTAACVLLIKTLISIL